MHKRLKNAWFLSPICPQCLKMTKMRENHVTFSHFCGASNRIWTDTPSRARDFKSLASADFAILAYLCTEIQLLCNAKDFKSLASANSTTAAYEVWHLRFTKKASPKTMPFAWRRHPDLNRGVKVLQTFALPLGYGAKKTVRKVRLERETRLEPATFTLARWRSTTELFPHNQHSALYGGSYRDRTYDPLLVRQMLSQLS